MVAFNTVLSASFTLLLASLQVAAQFNNPISSGVPTACKNECTDLVNSMQTCTSKAADQILSCVCSDKNTQSITKCFSCVIGLKESPITQQDAQTSIDQYVDACKAGGVNLKPVTVSTGKTKTSGNGALASGFVDVGAAAVAGMGVIYALL